MSVTTSAEPAAPKLIRSPIVIAPDIILDLIHGRGPRAASEARMLFDAIAADVEAGDDRRQAFIAPVTVHIVHHHSGFRMAGSVVSDLLALLVVVPLDNHDYHEATKFHNFKFDDALQFVACRRVDAKYLVTRNDFGVKRAPVRRRTAAEALPLFKSLRS